MNTCVYTNYKPLDLTHISIDNVQPGDVLEIDYIYVDGQFGNITVDGDFDPGDVISAMNQLEATSFIVSGSVPTSSIILPTEAQEINVYNLIRSSFTTWVFNNGFSNPNILSSSISLGQLRTIFHDFAAFPNLPSFPYNQKDYYNLYNAAAFDQYMLNAFTNINNVNGFDVTPIPSMSFSSLVNVGYLYANNVIPTLSGFTLPTLTNQLPELNLSTDDKIIWTKLITHFFSDAQSNSGTFTPLLLALFTNVPVDYGFTPFEASIVDQFYFDDVVAALIANEMITDMGPIGFGYVHGFTFNRTFNQCFQIINGTSGTIINNSGSIAVNYQLPGRTSIQKLSYFIKQFQNSDFTTNELQLANLWNKVNKLNFYSFGTASFKYNITGSAQNSLLNHSLGQSRLGKLIIEIDNKINVATAQLFEPELWKDHRINKFYFPYNNASELPKQVVKQLAVQHNTIWAGQVQQASGGGNLYKMIHPVGRASSSVAPIFPVLYNDNVLNGMGRVPMVYGAEVDGTLISFWKGLNTVSSSITVSTSNPVDDEILTQHAYNPIIFPYGQIGSQFQLDSTYDMIGFKPLAQISIGNRSQIVYTNHQSNSFNAASLVERNQKFYNQEQQINDGMQSIVYRIRKWPKVLDKNNDDITKPLLLKFYELEFGLTTLIDSASIQPSYFIDDKGAGLADLSLSLVYNDIYQADVDISSSYSIYRPNPISTITKPYLGGINVNRSFQDFQITNTIEIPYSASINYSGVTNISPSSGNFTYYSGSYFIDTRILNATGSMEPLLHRSISTVLTNYNLQWALFGNAATLINFDLIQILFAKLVKLSNIPGFGISINSALVQQEMNTVISPKFLFNSSIVKKKENVTTFDYNRFKPFFNPSYEVIDLTSQIDPLQGKL